LKGSRRPCTVPQDKVSTAAKGLEVSLEPLEPPDVSVAVADE
jgi:hypothetical protein